MFNLQFQRKFPKGETTQKHFKFQPHGKENRGSKKENRAFSFGAYILKRILNISGHFVEYSVEGWMAEKTQSQTFAQYI